jgi:DNA-binding IscR family transcriptional regulator
VRTLPPGTSEDVARVAGLNERYAREWLGGMVTAGIVTYDPPPTGPTGCRRSARRR